MNALYKLFNILALTTIAVVASAQTLSVEPIEGRAGEQKTMTVSLSDASSATALQFNLSLPANVTVDEGGCGLGAAASNHTLSVDKLDNGNYLFVLYSTDFTTLTNGTLVTIPVNIAESASSGNGGLYLVRSSKEDAVSYQHESVSFDVDVTTGPLKCATPTISRVDGRLSFSCATDGVTYVYKITASDEGEGGSVVIPNMFTLSVYAKKEGYENSEPATEVIENLKGDVDEDGVVDVNDVQTTINIILKK